MAGGSLVVFVMIAVVVGGVALGLHQRRSLEASGSIIHRNYDAIQTAHIYASPLINTQAFWDTFESSMLNNTGAEAQRTKSGAVQFTSQSYGYAALLEQLEDDGQDKRLQFSFAKWNERDGLVKHAPEMLVLLTSVEKTLLMIDPFVTVRHKRLATKSRAKLF